ncbi:Sm-like protein [Saccharomycopsis crataegensis]|uniref:Sm-like protein n=1 Tax=Saccharomycopsis crataegensis TaxID=43959 RepID=A0AAV5QQ06_9ASCO|nr:Sm-like protein [Saccharomycopsis crataegensis]
MEYNNNNNNNNSNRRYNKSYNNYNNNNNNNNNNYNNNYNNNNKRRYNNRRDNADAGNARKSDGPKREAILDLAKYKDQQIRVKFIGGRQVIGTLKGYDQLMNLVLDDVEETLRDPEDDTVLLKDQTRKLGQVVVRGPLLLTISPVDGSEIIDNPFVNEELKEDE